MFQTCVLFVFWYHQLWKRFRSGGISAGRNVSCPPPPPSRPLPRRRFYRLAARDGRKRLRRAAIAAATVATLCRRQDQADYCPTADKAQSIYIYVRGKERLLLTTGFGGNAEPAEEQPTLPAVTRTAGYCRELFWRG